MVEITVFNGKTYYFDWAIFNSYLKLPEDYFYSHFQHSYLKLPEGSRGYPDSVNSTTGAME